MTLLPTDSWDVKGRPDLPAYELNAVNADPFSGGAAEENHHIWRKSFSTTMRDAWWVELPSGKVIPNRVGLSRKSHQLITENKARISYNEETGLFYWSENVPLFLAQPLNPQPGPAYVIHTSASLDAALAGTEAVLPPDEPCPKCKGRGRLAKPDPAEHPRAPERPKTGWSLRVPQDERENGHEILSNLVDGSSELLRQAGLLKSATGARYYTSVYVNVFFQQNFNPADEVAQS